MKEKLNYYSESTRKHRQKKFGECVPVVINKTRLSRAAPDRENEHVRSRPKALSIIYGLFSSVGWWDFARIGEVRPGITKGSKHECSQ
jgi:hypothetical protein